MMNTSHNTYYYYNELFYQAKIIMKIVTIDHMVI